MARLGPTKIRIKSGNIVGGAAIKQAVQMVKMQLYMDWIEKMVSWINKYVPYRSGMLLNSALNTVLSSTVDKLYVGADVPYASYVNEMDPPINWTNPSSKYYFFKEMVAEGQRIVGPIITLAIRTVGLNQMMGKTSTEVYDQFFK